MCMHWKPTPGKPAILCHEILPFFSTSLFFYLSYAFPAVSDTYPSLVQVFKTKTSFQIKEVKGFSSITYTRFATDTPEKTSVTNLS